MRLQTADGSRVWHCAHRDGSDLSLGEPVAPSGPLAGAHVVSAGVRWHRVPPETFEAAVAGVVKMLRRRGVGERCPAMAALSGWPESTVPWVPPPVRRQDRANATNSSPDGESPLPPPAAITTNCWPPAS